MTNCAARGMWQTSVRYQFNQNFREYADGVVADSHEHVACDDLPAWAENGINLERMDASWNKLLGTRASLSD
jgi:hypothetical protein